MTETAPAPDGSISVSTLLCHRDVQTAIQCLKTVTAQCNVRLHIFDDGTITAEDAEILLAGIPAATIFRKEEYTDIVCDQIRKKPTCARYWSENLFRVKTLAIPLLSTGDIRYIDSDILFFRSCPSAFARSFYDCDAVFMSDIKEAYSVRPWHLIGRSSLRLCSKLNSGFILMAKEKYDLDFLEWVLSRYAGAFARFPWWADQTIWGALGARCTTRLICSSSIVLMRPGIAIDSSAVAGHFVSTFRYMLTDFAHVASTSDAGTLRTEPAGLCTPFRLSREILDAQLARLASI
jgi:hypothetical protein